MEREVKVLIVDDSAFNRKALREMIDELTGVTVVGTAPDGQEALKMLPTLAPDVITLDLEMPRMDGFTFLRLMMSNFPTPTIVISSRFEDPYVFKALELGAVDFIGKPTHRVSTKLLNIKEELHKKILMARASNLKVVRKEEIRPHKDKEARDAASAVRLSKEPAGATPVVVIGASTGGPPALQELVGGLRHDLNAPVAIAQHMPPGFTKTFAERLNRFSPLNVMEAEDNTKVSPGTIVIAPGGTHLELAREGDDVIAKVRSGLDEKYTPSVDLLFTSAALNFGDNVVAAIMTGMGSDGKIGIEKIKDAGGLTIAQSEDTSVIPGMPREAILTGKVDAIAPLKSLSSQITAFCDRIASTKARAS
ncbi:MAG: chemotaxis response regulator protein-glutamate methylesterase [Deltaproteobacteria bacterium]|nr:chemotaxis response regulator protein-glutamate methylesterase [Deltaproteobacteria bacterium]